MRGFACILAALFLLAPGAAVRGDSPDGEPPKLALIVDDFGYFYDDTVRGFLAVDASLTMSVIPGLPFSERIAGEIRGAEKGLLAHLPMEPIDYPEKDPGPDALFTNQSDAEIRARVRRALDSFHRLDGANNHMGSRAMQDRRLVRIVMEEIGDRNLFFLDSKTVACRVGRRTAAAAGVPCLENDLFWDTGYSTREEIAEGLDRLARVALERGFAVGIGHPRPVTLEVLREKLPELEALGIRLVPLAELIHGQRIAARNAAPNEGGGGSDHRGAAAAAAAVVR
ncbi:MAG: divergent polysaccharide deacetylase family protein [Candidatus Eisenbacteria bacterium]|nr:divergent polysaccharide deacetylase family protein [Candidatus Eisenbacteria bacterium]